MPQRGSLVVHSSEDDTMERFLKNQTITKSCDGRSLLALVVTIRPPIIRWWKNETILPMRKQVWDTNSQLCCGSVVNYAPTLLLILFVGSLVVAFEGGRRIKRQALTLSLSLTHTHTHTHTNTETQTSSHLSFSLSLSLSHTHTHTNTNTNTPTISPASSRSACQILQARSARRSCRSPRYTRRRRTGTGSRACRPFQRSYS